MKYNVEFDTVIEADSDEDAQKAAEHIAQRTRIDNPADIVTMEVAVVVERSAQDYDEADVPVIDLDTGVLSGGVELS